MRTAFIEELIVQARLHPEIFLVVGDLGYSVVEPFAAEFPRRYLNAGVAEQNMTGVAAGLASEGYHVFTYSIANFPTLRCLEQIRNDIAYHYFPVTIVSVGAGVAYGNLGYSHHAVQDIGIMRSIPELCILSPSDPGETRECVEWLANNPRPSYLRIGKAGEPKLHDVRGISRGPLRVLEGDGDVAVISTGSILREALIATREIEAKRGFKLPVFSCPWLQPSTAEFFAPLRGFKKVVVLEEHLAAGGLASLLRDNLPSGIQFLSCALQEDTHSVIGTQSFIRGHSGLNAPKIEENILKFLSV